MPTWYPYRGWDALPIAQLLAQALDWDPWTAPDPAQAVRLQQAMETIAGAAASFLASVEFEFIDRLYKLPAARQRHIASQRVHRSHLNLREHQRELRRLAPDLGHTAEWRVLLRRLRDGRIGFEEAVGDRQAALALRHGAARAGILSRSGPRWLHHLRDHRRDLRQAITAALDDEWLKGDVGQPSNWHKVAFVERVDQVHRLLTGRPLAHGITIKGRPKHGEHDLHSAGETGVPSPSFGIRLVRAAIDPLYPELTDEAIAHLIREAQQAPE